MNFRAIVLFSFLLSIQPLSAQKHEIGFGIGSSNDYFLGQETGVGVGARFHYAQTVYKKNQLSWGVGAALGFTQTTANLTPLGWRAKYTWKSTIPVLRTSIVYAIDPKLSAYGGLHLGLRFMSYERELSGNVPVSYSAPEFEKIYAFSGGFLGASYAVSPNFSGFAELGYDIMWFTLGVQYRLGKE